jgi:hypothetical protein
MNKKLLNGCLILIIVFAVLVIAYLVWTFLMMS